MPDIFGPKVLRGFNLFVDGRGHAGKVEELTLPKLTVKTEEFRAGGMDAPVELDMGMEKLECSFTLADYHQDTARYWGMGHGHLVSLTFRGALDVGDGLGLGLAIPAIARCQGMMKELDNGSWKPGEKLQQKFTVSLTYYQYSQAGSVIHEIDIKNFIRIVNGKDVLLATRLIIGR
jgi:P2 family phage contractile tail tube protein